MRKKYTPYLLLLPQIILLIIFAIGLINGITQSFGVIPTFGLREPTLNYYKEVLISKYMLNSILFSLYIAGTSSIFAVIIGTLICMIIVINKKTIKIYERLVQIPIVVPHVVVAIFILNIFSKSGLLARILSALDLISSQEQFINLVYDKYGIGIILAYLWKEIPFIIYFAISIMANINDSLGEAAINLGASKWETFRKVTLPLCKNTILSGFLIIFVFALGAYEIPQLLGPTLPKALPVLSYIQYIHPNLQNRPYAMALNGIIILISLISALLYYKLIKNNISALKDKNR
ncbi:ABC transporter permease [Terrisporobacter sp.]|uniref:ABC transporter permease n=1 Tax=Terrisporobacter sp. TaxID=1965305 RepID=UPI002634A795|nr:ABC transporter permease subunit [Terrisporobacter sp.]